MCVVGAANLHAAEGLYAIAGVPLSSMGESSPVVLYRVENGGLTKMRTIATLGQSAHVVRSYPEKGFVFVVSDGAFDNSFLVDIIELADMSWERSVDFDFGGCASCVYLKARLLERDGHLLFYLQAGGDGPKGAHVSQSVGLDMHSGEFVHDIDRADVTYLQHSGGQAGGVDGSDVVFSIGVRERRPEQPYVTLDSDAFDLGWRLPRWFSLPEGGWLVQVANNDDARVLRTVAPAGGTSEWLVLNKSAGRWHSFPLSTFPAGGDARLHGRWLIREDVHEGYDHAAWRGGRGVHSTPDRAWPAEKRRGEDPYWSAEVRAGVRRRTPTGVLQFYDTRTGNLAVKNTGHLDSETLMIDEHDVVYFRVGDELRRAAIRDGTLANEETISNAPELLAVHWLFRASTD